MDELHGKRQEKHRKELPAGWQAVRVLYSQTYVNQVKTIPGTKVTINDSPELSSVKAVAITQAMTVPMMKSVLLNTSLRVAVIVVTSRLRCTSSAIGLREREYPDPSLGW